MKSYQLTVVIVSLLLLTISCEAKKRKHHKSSDESSESSKTKTKTKWSSSSNLGPQTKNSMVATEEHGYYVKRTFLPLSNDGKNSSNLKSPPFLAVPIAWFPCKDADCLKLNSLALNSNKNSLDEGFLCDDDCTGPYEPICGKTSSEVAVFYNKCKLNVAKCRSHGYWSDIAYEDCKTQYPEEVKYAEMKFCRSPYFRRSEEIPSMEENKTENSENLVVEETTTLKAEEVLIQEIKDSKPVEKIEESKDSYKEIKTASGIVTEMKL
ncbi:uncharacterized protein LOC111683833 [Lucilia cuprina]|uniref:uncharacterized protein LOC111683833 n=1 Tax=Lucilia cuprina TaxID=7375 RepID=UPI001F0529B8|nr:uncharacterized protein LOC111683833 [Lucilia cuprina]